MALRRTEHLVSAGGVVHRVKEGKGEVLLCGRGEPRIWGLPKGLVDRGESLEEAATREVAEETGLEVAIAAKIGTISYWFARPEGVRCHKTVHHYLMVPTGGDVSHHDWEHDEVRWFTEEEAYRTLTYKNEVEVVRKGIALIAEQDGKPA